MLYLPDKVLHVIQYIHLFGFKTFLKEERREKNINGTEGREGTRVTVTDPPLTSPPMPNLPMLPDLRNRLSDDSCKISA